MGTTRVIIAENGTTAGQYDYDAWGEVIWQSDTPPRKGFIDKEKDAESGDHNFGVRQYKDGKFWSTDPDWEKYRAWSPYNYAENNPVKLKDPSGRGSEQNWNGEVMSNGKPRHVTLSATVQEMGAVFLGGLKTLVRMYLRQVKIKPLNSR